MALQVAKWDRYEKADSKKCVTMSWVAVPINHSGLSFLEMMSRPDGLRTIGGWLLILQVAAQCPTRGLLVSDSGRLIGAREIALKTRANESDITECIAVLLEYGWLIEVNMERSNPDDIRTTSGLQDRTEHDSTGEGEAQGAGGGPPVAKKFNNREKIAKELRRRGISDEASALTQWCDMLSGLCDANNLEEALEDLDFLLASAGAKGVRVDYAKHVRELAEKRGRWRSRQRELALEKAAP